MDIVAQMGMFNNLLPTPDRIIGQDPTGFFGLMLQLYIVYRLLLFRRHWAVTVGLMVACTVIQMACDPESEALNRWRYNFVGGMLPFGAGLLYARYATGLLSWRDGVGHARFDTLNLMVSVVLIFLLSFNYLTWYLVPLCVCSASIACVRLFGETPWLDGIGRILVWTGTLARHSSSATPSRARSSYPSHIMATSMPDCCSMSSPRSAWHGSWAY